MGRNDEYFDDVPELRDEASFGALGGDGAAALEQTKTKLSREGVATSCLCGQCGRPNIIVITWPEVITGSMAAVPAGWQVNQKHHALSPFENTGCGCGYWIELLFTPQELAGYVQKGLQQGILSPQDVGQQKASIQAQLQQGRPPQRR